MEKKLAIRGHATRGKEVIELLEMMGGKNNCDSPADNLGLCYLIDDEFDICAHYFGYDDYEDGELTIFTLEEFLEKFPFKVGDFVRIPEYESEVRILKMKWCPLSKYIEYLVYRNDDEEWYTAEELLEYNDNPLEYNDNPTNISKMKNVLAELLEHIKTTPKDELEREFEEIKEWSNVGPTVEEFMTFCECVNKKPKYPTSYAECCEVVNACPIIGITCGSDEDMLYNDEVNLILLKLRKLLICRDAYWKIAGEQLGLDKPWEPDWTNEYKKKFCIYYGDGNIQKGTWSTHNSILAFPTEEMRDAFYENFKELIESCKELL